MNDWDEFSEEISSITFLILNFLKDTLYQINYKSRLKINAHLLYKKVQFLQKKVRLFNNQNWLSKNVKNFFKIKIDTKSKKSILFTNQDFLFTWQETKKEYFINQDDDYKKYWLFNIFLTILATCFDWHIPVLYKELIYSIEIDKNKQNIVVDATLWLGWHARWIIEKLWKNDIFIWFDADKDNLEQAKINIEKHFWDSLKNKNIKLFFIYSNFRFLEEKLKEIWITKITHIYYDFWVNSVHYDNAEKWFSFRFDWPLDLRFDKNTWITASYIVNNYDESALKNIFYKFWEEKKTPFIVKEIIESRKQKKILTTFDLLGIIEKSSFDPKSKTRIFQALRIEVNNEFSVIKESLSQAISILDNNWTITCITFHSLEDKLVKEIFWELTKDEINDYTWHIKNKWLARKITRKPIIPDPEEIINNPRSRSAKLRIIQKN